VKAFQVGIETDAIKMIKSKIKVRVIQSKVGDSGLYVPAFLDFNIKGRSFGVPSPQNDSMAQAIDKDKEYSVYFIEAPALPLLLSLEPAG
jgi:hypothetical protein